MSNPWPYSPGDTNHSVPFYTPAPEQLLKLSDVADALERGRRDGITNCLNFLRHRYYQFDKASETYTQAMLKGIIQDLCAAHGDGYSHLADLD